MMTMLANKQPMKYALYLYNLDVVATDYNGNPQYYEDLDGERTYIVTGEKKSIFSEPVEFDANISFSGGEAQEQEYGLSIADFDAILLYSKDAYPLTEGTLVWTKSFVEYEEDAYLTSDLHELIQARVVKQISADFICKKVADSLNYTKVNLTAINK